MKNGMLDDCNHSKPRRAGAGVWSPLKCSNMTGVSVGLKIITLSRKTGAAAMEVTHLV